MKVTEIFFSLQGEGRNQGKPALFIRLAGCNLNCRWCDTGYARSPSAGREMNVEEVIGQVRCASPKNICITGGEPLIQAESLEPLLASLSGLGIDIDIETNGTLDFRRLQPYASVCMDVKCPSSGEESDLSLLDTIRPTDSVKFVVNDIKDCRYTQEIIRTHRIAGEIFVTPVFGSDYTAIAEFIIADRLPVRFQVQLHKIIGVR
jgi:7-carboxy-7-deazaguanine synthase